MQSVEILGYMTWLLHEGIFHVEGVLKPAIFESLPWAYMMCKCAQILIGERHWLTELGIGHLWSWVGFMAAQIFNIHDTGGSRHDLGSM